jgi:hypothetical protein
MGIGPGLICNFNSLDLSNMIEPSTLTIENQQYFTAVGNDLFPSQVNNASFAGLQLQLSFSNTRDQNANSIARIIKQDNAATANGPPSCDQFVEIAQV